MLLRENITLLFGNLFFVDGSTPIAFTLSTVPGVTTVSVAHSSLLPVVMITSVTISIAATGYSATTNVIYGSTVIPNLAPGAPYNITVVGNNEYGAGIPSTILVTTLPPTGINPPTLVAYSDTSIQLSWGDGGLFSNYSLEMSENDTSNFHSMYPFE